MWSSREDDVVGAIGTRDQAWSTPQKVGAGVVGAAAVTGGGLLLSRLTGMSVPTSLAMVGALAGVGLLATAAFKAGGGTPHKGNEQPDATGPAVGPGVPPAPGEPNIDLKKVATGLKEPVQIAAPPGSDELWVVQKSGQLVRIDGEKPETVLDISKQVQDSGEMGLLSMAFHPDYATNGKLYVSYNDDTNDSQIVEFVAKDGVIDPKSARPILSVDQPDYGNHKGGQLQFGPDGLLYAAFGDGGSGGDPHANGQNMGTLLSKLIRIDIDHRDPGLEYSVPKDNPYVNDVGARPEIWASGLRNPWRFSFDRETGDMYIADVGQNAYEEVDFLPRDAAGGANFGWSVREGAHDYNTDQSTGPGRIVEPVVEYTHDSGASITGGFVYRGDDIPALKGYYLYSDFADGHLRGFELMRGAATNLTQWKSEVSMPAGFGEGGDGELYVASLTGDIFQVVAAEGGEVVAPPPTPGSGKVVTLHVTANRPMEFDQKELTLPAGPVTLRAEVQSSTPHNIAIEEIDPDTGEVVPGSERANGKVVGKGETSELTFNLEKGKTYRFYCALHYGMMQGTITVE